MVRPLERDEQKALAAWLDAIGLCWAAVPNGAHLARGAKSFASLKAQGARPGVPDVLIFTPPPRGFTYLGPVGAAIELKRQGATASAVTPEQRQWLADLERLGWATSWQPGAAAAIKWLERLGYGK